MNVWPCTHLPAANGLMTLLWPAGRLAWRPMASHKRPKKKHWWAHGAPNVKSIFLLGLSWTFERVWVVFGVILGLSWAFGLVTTHHLFLVVHRRGTFACEHHTLRKSSSDHGHMQCCRFIRCIAEYTPKIIHFYNQKTYLSDQSIPKKTKKYIKSKNNFTGHMDPWRQHSQFMSTLQYTHVQPSPFCPLRIPTALADNAWKRMVPPCSVPWCTLTAPASVCASVLLFSRIIVELTLKFVYFHYL